MTTLVLLPGMDGTGKLFAPLLAALSPRLHVIVVRYPTAVPLDYEDLVGLARAELPAEEEFVILGESFSGPVAVSLATQAPPKLRGLILCASFVCSPVPWPAMLKPLTHLRPLGAIPAGVLSVPLLGRFRNSRTRRSLADALATVHANVLRARIRSVLAVDRIVGAPYAACCLLLAACCLLLQISPTAAAQAIEAFVDMALLQEPLAGGETNEEPARSPQRLGHLQQFALD